MLRLPLTVQHTLMADRTGIYKIRRGGGGENRGREREGGRELPSLDVSGVSTSRCFG